MRTSPACLTAAVLSVAASFCCAQVSPSANGAAAQPASTQPAASRPAADAAEIDRLIKQLGSDKFAEREAAQQTLVKIGLPAVEQLRAATMDKDVERAQQARTVLEQLALRREDWPVGWHGMTLSFRLRSSDPAKSMELTVDQDRRARCVEWNPTAKSPVQAAAVLSQEAANGLHGALGGLLPWTLAGAPARPAADTGVTLELTITAGGKFVRIQRPWPDENMLSLKTEVLHLSDILRREEAIRTDAAKAGKIQQPAVKEAGTLAQRLAKFMPGTRPAGLPPTGEIHGQQYSAALNSSGEADLARGEYEKKYDAAGHKSPFGKADPNTPVAKDECDRIERLFRDAIDKCGISDTGVYTRHRLSGLYAYCGKKEQATAMAKEADELKALVGELKQQHQLRRAAADWPELAALVRLLSLPWTQNVERPELAAAVGKLGKRSDEAVGRVMEEFWPNSDYAYRWRTIIALGEMNSERSRQALLELALGAEKDDMPWIRGAAQEYARILKDKSEVRKLLASQDDAVLCNAAMALRGVKIDKDMIGRLLELTRRPEPGLRRLVIETLGADPGRQFAADKVGAIVQAIPDVAKMDKADSIAWPGSWTNVEVHYRVYIDAMARIGDTKLLAKALAQAKAGEPTWRCLALASALAGDEKARPEVRKLIADAGAGLFRAWAAEALGKIGAKDDLPLLREVAQKDPMQRERGGCMVPINKDLYFPVREAAKNAIKALESHPNTQPAAKPAAAAAGGNGR